MNEPKERQSPLPTEAELEILQILWANGPQTVRETHEALRGRRTGYTTVLKQMQVMTEKGLLKRNERFRSHVYAARHGRERTQQHLVLDFLQRAFSGSAKNLVLGALSARRVSRQELAEIKEVVRKFEEESQ